MTFYHYFEKERGPFKNLSDIPLEQAKGVMNQLRGENCVFAACRDDSYLERRMVLEAMARSLFIQKGGKPVRKVPHYMVVERCDWLLSWYREGECVAIDAQDFDWNTVSFTYGDMFPTFSPRVSDGKEYRNTLYTFPEIVRLIEKYGLPQLWNKDGLRGPERYIEVQIWTDEPIRRYYEY